MSIFLILLIAFIISIPVLLILVLKSRNMNLWIMSYIKQRLKDKSTPNIKNIYFCLADHYEPYFGSASENVARQRVTNWCENYPKIAKKHTDSSGNHPKHSYFYPEEEYDEEIINKIKLLCDKNMGDVEIHLHHDNDTADNLEKTLNSFKELLHTKHGLLRKDKNGNIVYGFIHGNWALDNSRPDGKWCGIDNEIDVLIKTGCVYDMTMPSAPSNTQTKTINSIYLAKEDGKCKSHNTGRIVNANTRIAEDELLMIQGPLTLNWYSRKLGLIPRIESGELSFDAPPNNIRSLLWESCNVSIDGDDKNIFIKLHTHGLEDQNVKMFFELNGFENLWSSLEASFRDRDGYSLYYVTAWEMYEKIIEISKN
ncbi:hypothetical protein MNBD_GAMMA09-233 [hydrothermal vent metagenome]|uniref:Uncharacterized protein n=1 Tax=hydrothermal vent metagenome TaxID=652676 RepID=A0A3B0XPA7_9ZZZZ